MCFTCCSFNLKAGLVKKTKKTCKMQKSSVKMSASGCDTVVVLAILEFFLPLKLESIFSHTDFLQKMKICI